MFNHLLSSLLVVLIFTSVPVHAQDHSIQLNGGIISPVNAVKGFSGFAQFNYSINEKSSLYVYSGYSYWNKDIVIYYKDYTVNQPKTHFRSYSADEHYLIPVFFGGKMDMHSNKYFTSFLTAEAGYAHLKYNTYRHITVTDNETGEVLDVYADANSRNEQTDNLFGIGIGAGLYHSLSAHLQLVFSYKLNSYVGSRLFGLFSSKGTYSVFLAGISYGI